MNGLGLGLGMGSGVGLRVRVKVRGAVRGGVRGRGDVSCFRSCQFQLSFFIMRL